MKSFNRAVRLMGADIDDWLEAEKEILQQRSQAAR
jgi:hypothetical protein